METGFMNRITGLVIALVVGGLLVGGLLAPTVAGIQDTVGTKTTVNNTMREPGLNYNLWDGSDIEIKFVFDGGANSGTYYINDVEQTDVLNSLAQRIVIASNAVCARTAGGVNPVLNIQTLGGTAGFTHSFTFTIENGTYTFTDDQTSDTITGDLEWMVFAADEGDLNLGTLNVPTNAFYTSNTDKLVILGNVYTTGDNDTFYSYYDGDLTVNEEYQDVSNVVISRTLADGYTDIYNTTVTVNIGEESFTPYFILAPKTVTGHEAGGAFYILFGVIVLLGIVMLIVVAANGIRNKY